jgi:uncharacterized membrane protein YccC
VFLSDFFVLAKKLPVPPQEERKLLLYIYEKASANARSAIISTMLQTLLKLKPRDVPIVVALRNTAAVTLPLITGIVTGHLGVGLGISVGALNTMFSDQPGPYRLRMTRMLFAATAAGVSAFVGYTLGGSTVLIAFAALIWGVSGGLLVALGPEAGRIGLTSMILLVITASDPRSPADAIGPALLFFAGGLLLTLFAIAAWPLQRYRPERTALAQLCRGLAASARQHDDSGQAPPVTQALMDVESQLHGSYRARGAAMEAFRVLAELIERTRLEVLALGGLSERVTNQQLVATLQRLREYAARALDSIATALDAGASPLAASAALEGFDAALTALGGTNAEQLDPHDRRSLTIALAHGYALAGQLRAAVRNADFAGSSGELRLDANDARLPRELRPRNALAILRANFRLSSIACRHAIRCGVCLAIAVTGERLSGISHGYWIPMTTAIVLKPDFAGTFSFGLLRVIGTLLGLALTTTLLHFAFGDDWQRIVLFTLLCFGFRELTTVHYGLGVMLLTGLIVVLLTFEGISPGETMIARAIGTSLGSALALLAYILWPTWERGRVRASLGEMLDSYRRYFSALVDGSPRVRTDVRSASRSSRTNALASLDRLRGEPRRDPRLVALAEGVFANANRFMRAAMALEASRQNSTNLPAHAQIMAFAGHIDSELEKLSESLRAASPAYVDNTLRTQQRALATALEAAASNETEHVLAAAWIDASDRMTDSIDTIGHLLEDKKARKTAG